MFDSLDDARPAWLAAAVVLHVCAQLARGLAWRGVLAAAWPPVARRRVCAWYVCGAGLTGVLSARGGDLVRVGLARRVLPGATWPALAGTLVAEGSFESACGIVLGLVAGGLGVHALGAPSPVVLAAVLVAVPVATVLAVRSTRLRRIGREVARGLTALRCPRAWARGVLPWQLCARTVRFASVCCFLAAFSLPVTPAVVIAACAALGSGGMLPIPGAGPAAMGAALLIAVPVAAGGHVDGESVRALAMVVPTALTIVGATLSVALLAVFSGARTPRAFLKAQATLAAEAVAGPTPVAAMRSGSRPIA